MTASPNPYTVVLHPGDEPRETEGGAMATTIGGPADEITDEEAEAVY